MVRWTTPIYPNSAPYAVKARLDIYDNISCSFFLLQRESRPIFCHLKRGYHKPWEASTRVWPHHFLSSIGNTPVIGGCSSASIQRPFFFFFFAVFFRVSAHWHHSWYVAFDSQLVSGNDEAAIPYPRLLLHVLETFMARSKCVTRCCREKEKGREVRILFKI